MRSSIRAAILAEANAAKALIDVAEREERDLSDVERESIDAHMTKAAELRENAAKEKAFHDQLTDLSAGLGVGEDPEQLKVRRGEKNRPGGQSVGDLFAQSKEYKALVDSVPSGAFSEKIRVQSSPLHVGSMKSLFYTGDHNVSGGPSIETDHRGLLDPYYQRPLSVRGLFSQGSTETDTIDYVRMINVVNNAAPVAEATSSGKIDPVGPPIVTPVQGGLKPESGFEMDRDQTTVKTIAHWMPITKRALADAKQIRTMIDQFLRYGLEEEFEDQLLTGTGVGENFLGLNNTPGIQTQTGGAGQDALDVTRLARTKVQIGGRAAPTAYVMNPLDWQDVELLRNVNGDFVGAGPFALTAPRLWGLPVIMSEAVAPKTAWVAGWNYGVIYDREQATVTASDSHNDFFTRNLVAILAEMRAAFAILRPPAFVKITLP